MDYSQINILRMMQTKMAWLSERQDRLAQNIANADTPGYEAKDLKPLDFSRQLQNHQRLQMMRTSPEHMQGVMIRAPEYKSVERKDFFERKPADNKVNVEDEMEKIDQTALAYNMTTDLYRKTTRLFKVAINNK